MKQLTPEFFLRTSFDKNIKPLGGCLDFDEGMQENGFDWVFEAMQAYAKHCEESAWVSVDEFLPERWEGHPITRNCFLFNGKEYLIGFYSYSHSQWRADDYAPIEGITHWRPLPKPPKK